MTRREAIEHVLSLSASVDGEHGGVDVPRPTLEDTLEALYSLGVNAMEIPGANPF